MVRANEEEQVRRQIIRVLYTLSSIVGISISFNRATGCHTIRRRTTGIISVDVIQVYYKLPLVQSVSSLAPLRSLHIRATNFI